jgi:hypothetical protein
MKEKIVVLAILGLFVLSCLPMFSEPYHHQFRVNFWAWAKREVIELIEGEKSL